MPFPLAAWPTDFALHLRYLTPLQANGLFAVLAAATVLVGWRSLKWLGPWRQWSIIGFRLVLLYCLVLLLGGAEAVRTSDELEVVVLRDVSASTDSVALPNKASVETVLDNALRGSAKAKPPADRLGTVGFDAGAWVDALPQAQLRLDARAVRNPESGTDVAGALRLGMVCFRGDAMKRLVLVSDGNANQGNLDAAVDAAVGAHVPVDVLPLNYRIDSDVMIDRLVAPVWRRQGEPFHLDVVLRSAGAADVKGRLEVTHQGLPIDLDPQTPGVQSAMPATLHQGTNVVHVTVPPSVSDGVHRFKATFVADGGSAAARQTVDALPGNNAAEGFTFVRGKGRVLYVDNYPPGEGDTLLAALRSDGVGISDADHVTPDRFPATLLDLQSYDAVILANVPRGPGGISDEQGQLLARYVKDTGGGLLMAGGPLAFGAGGWQGSELAKVLPVNLDVPAERALPSGALVMVIDHSGSMSGPMDQGGTVKMQSAKQSALLALKTMLPGDYLGVIQFDSQPDWVVPLDKNRDPRGAADAVRLIEPAGGTSIYPGLDLAEQALAALTPQQAASKHILLLTDGQSVGGDYPGVIARMRAHKITLSTIAVGGDADTNFLADLAKQGKGNTYVVTDPTKLTQVFVREARTVRRSLIQEPAGGIVVGQKPGNTEILGGLADAALPRLGGIVLTSQRNEPQVQTALVNPGKFQDPILASWQIGLGRVAVWTGDATNRWSKNLIESRNFDKLWTQLLRTVARAPMSGDFDVRTERDGNRTKIVVEALADRGVQNGLTIAGTVAGPNPDRAPGDLRLTQTGPGRYEASFNTPDGGAYVTALQYRGPQGQRGTLLAGTSADDAPEKRDLSSNDGLLEDVARRTGGRVLPALGTAEAYDLFSHEGLEPARAFLPLNWLLLPLAATLLVLDVAIRRLQIDKAGVSAAWAGATGFVRSFTTVRRAEGTAAVDALRKVRDRETAGASAKPAAAPPPRPDPKRKFDAPTIVAGDITSVVGGAKNQPAARPAASGQRPATAPGEKPADTTSSLLAAKRRAQEKMNEQG